MEPNSFIINPTHFPRSYYFYSTVLSEYPILAQLSQLFVFFSYIQSFLTCFVPILILNENEDEFAELKDILKIFLGFSSAKNFLRYDKAEIYILPISLSLAIASVLIMYYAYSTLRNTSTFFFKIRGFLFIFVPTCFFYQPALFFGYSGRLIMDDDATLSQYISIIILLISFILLVYFTFFISPLILKNPLFSASHIPTFLFPSFDFIFHGLIDFFYIFFSVLLRSIEMQSTIYVFYFIYSVYHIYKLYKIPYLNHFDTTFSVTTDIAHILFVPTSIAVADRNCQTEYFFPALAATLVIIVALKIFIDRKGNEIVAMMETEEMAELDDDKIIYCVQEALTHNSIDKSTVSLIEQSSDNLSRIDSIAIGLYIKLLAIDQNIKVELSHNLYVQLLKMTTMPNYQRYFLFELLRAYTRNDTGFTLQMNDPLIEIYDEYQNLSVVFWENTIKGKLKKAYDNVCTMNERMKTLSERFRQYRSIYPSNQSISLMEQNFMSTVSPECTPKISRAKGESDITIRYNQFIKVPTESIISSLLGEKDITNDLVDEGDSEYSIKRTMYKHVMKGLSPRTIILFIIYFLCILAFSAFSMSYTCLVIEKSKDIDNFFEIEKNIMMLTNSWSSVTLAIGHIINETDSLGTETLQTYLDALNASSSLILNSMRRIFMANDFLSSSTSLQSLRNVFLEPVVDFFPFTNDTSQIDDMKFDIKSLMLYYATYISEHMETEGNETSYNQLIQHFKERYYKFAKVSSCIYEQLFKMNTYLDEYSNSYITQTDITYKTQIMIICFTCVFMLSVPAVNYIFKISLVSEIKSDIKKAFRPQEHPMTPDEVDYVKEPEDYKVRTVTKFNYLLFITSIVSYLINVGLCLLIHYSYRHIWDVSNALLYVHRFTISASSELDSTLKAWQFSDANGNDYKKNAINASARLVIDTIASYHNFSKTIFNTDELYNYTHSIYDNYSFYHFYDFFKCWAIQFKQFLISFYGKEFALEDYPDDISRSFIKIQKVMIRYSVPIHENMTTELEDMFHNSVKESYFTLYFTLTFNVIALIFGIVYAFKFIFKASTLKGQLGRLIMDLDPVFIARNPAMVEYIVGKAQEFLEWMNGSPVFDILNASGTPLLVVSDRYSIMAFTEKVTQLFDYRPEQLIGQHYTMLFKRKSDTLASTQDSFFQRITELLTQNTGSTSRVLNGIASDGSYVRVDVHASVVTCNNRKYIIFELRSLKECAQIEDATAACQETIKEMVEKSIPLSLFPTQKGNSKFVSRRFYGGILVFTAIDTSNQIKGATEIIKSPLEKTIPLFSGADDALVIASTGTYALVIFTDANGLNEHTKKAVKFVKEYALECESGVSQVSLMLDIPSFEAIQFLPPEVPKEFDGVDIPADVSSSFAPAMTTDPFIPALDEISDMLSILRSDMVLVSSNIAEQLDQTCQLLPVTLINAKRQMFAIKLSALSLKPTAEEQQK